MTQPPENQPPNTPEPPSYPTYPGSMPAGGYQPPPAAGYPPAGYPTNYGTGAGSPFAGWWQRVGAVILDSLPSAAIGVIGGAILGDPFTVTTDAADQVHFETSGSSIAVIYGLGLIWVIINWIYLQGKTGQTIGKRVVGIAVYRAGTTQPMGYGLAVGRYFARFLDIIPCYLGLLWPLWDNEHRTFADMICGTRVYRIR